MSAVDFLSSDAGHRESPQQRILITAENAPKRKMMGPALIKLEASDVSNAAVGTLILD